jgi:hypothetical protein
MTAMQAAVRWQQAIQKAVQVQPWQQHYKGQYKETRRAVQKEIIMPMCPYLSF